MPEIVAARPVGEQARGQERLPPQLLTGLHQVDLHVSSANTPGGDDRHGDLRQWAIACPEVAQRQPRDRQHDQRQQQVRAVHRQRQCQ